MREQKVSVILPCHNGARWVSEAIMSVLNQTYENFELVIVNDGSKDNSEEVISRFIRDSNVIYIYQKNRGFSAAINRGIKESTGDLIGFIGQDDLWLPYKLELQVEYLCKRKEVDLIFSPCYSIDSEGKFVGVNSVKLPNLSSKEALIEELFLRNFIGFETVLVRKKCFGEVGLFDERMTGFSDHDMWLRIVGKFNIGYIDMPLVKKREHEFQLSKVRVEEVLRDEFLLVEKAVELYPYLKMVMPQKLSCLYYALGLAYISRGKHAQARKYLQKAAISSPYKGKVKALIASAFPIPYMQIMNASTKFAGILPGFKEFLKFLEG